MTESLLRFSFFNTHRRAQGVFSVLVLLFVLTGCHKDPIEVNHTNPPVISLYVSTIFQDNMVVQRDKPVAVWGQATAGAVVNVSASWAGSAVMATTATDGNWTVNIPAAAANASPQTITITATGAKTVTISDVLVGDVWVCSGQSNMVMPMDSMPPFDGVTNYQQEIADANYPLIRILTVPQNSSFAPLNSFDGPFSWQTCSPATIGATSAVAYYFARQLQTTLNVPVGIIVSAVDGSYCQQWTNSEAIASSALLEQVYSSGASVLYNAMINPLIPMTIKGFTWYQGEQNEGDQPVSNFTPLNAALISGWRSKFNDETLPFYYVQITPFLADYDNTSPPGSDTTSDNLAFFREAQAGIRNITTNTGMVITMDVGDDANHHPPDKKPVGQRLAYLALNHTYGQNVQSVGPQFASWSATGNAATVNFVTGTATGLCTTGNTLLKQYFFVAGTDKVFREGKAAINGNSIVITAPAGTPLPVTAIRYAFTNGAVTNLQNGAGLPAEPFRTDNWTN